MFDSIPLCRVCLKTSLEYIDLETPYEPDPSNKSSNDAEELTYLDCFLFCTRLEIEFAENLPQSLCSSCGLELKIAYEFLKKAKSAAKILQDAAERTKLEQLEADSYISCADKSSELVEVEKNFKTEELCIETTLEEEKSIPSQQNDTNMNEENTFGCIFCGEQFFSQFILTLHTNRMHKNSTQSLEEATNESELEFSYLNDDGGDDEILTSEYLDGDGEDDNALKEFLPNDDEGEDNELNIIYFQEDEQSKELSNDNQLFQTPNIFKIDPSQFDPDGQLSLVDKLLTEKEKLKITKSAYKRCEVCHRFVKTASYSAHMTFHGGRLRSFDCENCTSSFYSKRALQLHCRTSHQIKTNNTCKICAVDIGDTPMKKHIQDEHIRMVSCTKCDYKGQELKLHEHMKRSHSDSKDFLCNVCSKTFSTLGVLNAHLKYHERKLANIKSDACKVCGKQFSTKNYLRAHMEVHKNDRKLFKCDNCEKMYVSKTALDNHSKLHKGETIKCLLCPKQFARQYELNVHMRFHTRDYPFKCEICEKKFAIKGHLRTHMWRHQGLKLQCEDCGKLFTSTKALQEHSFIHSEMPFPCPYCPKAYPSKQKIKVHLKTSHFLELTDVELQKLSRIPKPKQLVRKRVTLVQADTVMKEIVVKTKNVDDEDADSP